MHPVAAAVPFILSSLLVGCGSRPATTPDARVTPPATAPAATAPAPATGCELLQARHPDAAFLLYLPAQERYLACDPARTQRVFLPASTFKVANALIGLETGAVRDADAATPWDGTRRAVPAWNQDTSLATGMRNSTVWFYQAMARRIGPQRMRQWVRRLDYGNAEIGPDAAIDHFWLDGALRISAVQEVAFLDRLRRRALPASRSHQDTVARILERDRGEGWVLRAKTGAAVPIDATGNVVAGQALDAVGSEPVGWYVGWVERDAAHGGDAVFAFNLRLRDDADMPLRETLARELLAANGVLPPPAAKQ